MTELVRHLLLPWLGRGLAAVLVVVALGGAISAPDHGRIGLTSRCHGPADLTRFDQPLRRSAQHLRRDHRLTVVAIGSSSTAGFGAGAPSRSYPSTLGRSLAQLFPEATVRVINRGVNGEDAPKMLERFERDVLTEHPDLVIWQIGSNAVIRQIPLGEFKAAIADGIRRLQAAHIDVVLMNPQFTPALGDPADGAAYLKAIDSVARAAHVPVFERYQLMRYWIGSGQVGGTELWNTDRLHMSDLGYRCVGEQLALSIAAASR